MKLIRRSIYGFNVLLVCILLVSCVACYLNPLNIGLASLLSLSFPIWAGLNVLMIIYWMIIEPKRIWLSFVGLLLCCNSVMSIVNVGFGKQESTKRDLTVMSYNMGGSFHLNREKRKEKKKWLPQEFNAINADIIALQESSTVQGYENELVQYESHHFAQLGTSIYSKYPILDKGKIDFKVKVNSGVWIDIEVRGERIRVYSIHLKSNSISHKEMEALNDINNSYESNVEETRSILSKYRKENKIRAKQVNIVLDHIAKSPYRVIVCGDFNEPPFSYIYKSMSNILKDSFREKGRGLEATYSGNLPFLRIDYVFTDPEIKIKSHELSPIEWSDHYPLIVGIEL